MKKMFTPKDFFDLSAFDFSDIFKDAKFVWEPIGGIQNYIIGLFKTGRLKPNYGKNIFIGKDTLVEDYAVIKGPAIIGKNCFIGHASYLRGGCILGDNVHIGHGAEIKNSILLNNAIAAHLNYIGDSIIGSNVNISGGAMLANFRFDKKSVTIKTEDKRIDTGLSKFGAILGDNSTIGVNAVLNPGTLLGKNTIVYPLTSVKGVHKDGEVIR